MLGWNALQTAGSLQTGFAVAAVLSLLLCCGVAGFAAMRLRSGGLPEWIDLGQYQLSRTALAASVAVLAGIALLLQLATLTYGLRHRTLASLAEQGAAEAHRANTDKITKLSADMKARPSEVPNHYRQENAELRKRLDEAEAKVAQLERSEMQKRLSPEQREFLIQAIKPFAGQQVSIASSRGDAEAGVLVQDFVAAFETAGWDHHGEQGITVQDWPRDPVGVEIALNEDDARNNKITGGIAALINAVRQLGLVYDSTIYMDNEVPPGQALVKVGKKLKR